MNMQPKSMSRLALELLAGGLTLMLSGIAMALDIAQVPLYLPTPLAPNVVLTLDDSGSMAWAAVPDSIARWGNENTEVKKSRRWKSAHFNPLYYNPNVTYIPPVDANGTPLSTSFTQAWRNGFDHSRGSVNLSNGYRPMDVYKPSSDCSSTNINVCHYVEHPAADFTNTTDPTRAYYYVFDSSLSGCNGTKDDDDCYRRVWVGENSGPGGTDERQNFANWYSFYRTRNLMTVTAAALAFHKIPEGKIRLAWQALSSCNSFGTSCKGWTTTTYDNRIRNYQGSHRTNFYNWLFRLPADARTPLREALKRAGEYFRTSGLRSPYAFNPQVTASPEYSCRPNFSILMTDGMWNDSVSGFGNADGTSKILPDGKAYSPIAPYRDNHNNTLADIAFYYWSNDLRTNLDNNMVPYMPDRTGNATQQYWNPKNDPASWQHMVTFTVGLGLSGSLGDDWIGDTHGGPFYSGLLAGSRAWPQVGPDVDPGNVYDLWHAALNSRGRFFSAERPEDLVMAFEETLNRVMERQSSASAVATNSTRLATETVIYQARFNSADWSGQLLAIPLNSDGSIGTVLWDAAEKIPAAASRNIKTWNGTAGADFTWDGLSPDQRQTLLGSSGSDGSGLVNYLRGDASGEVRNGGSYRNREKVLGDIVNSDPVFAGSQNFGYDLLPGTEGSTYKAFLATKSSVPKMLYVGANDGMLHGFDASTGVERFAYVPNDLMTKLTQLSSPSYSHQYYVDGSPWVGDAYLNGAWRSVLVGGTGAGGKAVFALDVSNPASFSASHVLWEFTHADLGYTIGQPIIARLNDGRWAAVFGNGYASTGGTAKLFIVYLDANASDGWQLGTDFLVLDTNTTAANGLSSPTLYDSNGDRIADYVYAGDLQGNVWKFDLSSTNPSQWKVANRSGSTPIPFFTARNAANQVQPITAPIEIGPAPSGGEGVMLYFGTGRFFAVGDNTNTQVQTFYALWDNYTNNNEITYSCTSNSCNRDSTLQAQTILYEGSGPGGNSVRVTSNASVDYNSKRGWYLDLKYPNTAAGEKGERVVSAPLLRHGRVIFTTLIPSSDPCKFGGGSWIMELAASTGSRLDHSVFDLNDDNLFNASDYVTVNLGGGSQTVPVSGLASRIGIIKTPSVISAGEKEYKLASGTTGEIASVKERGGGMGFGRVSWQELFTP